MATIIRDRRVDLISVSNNLFNKLPRYPPDATDNIASRCHMIKRMTTYYEMSREIHPHHIAHIIYLSSSAAASAIRRDKGGWVIKSDPMGGRGTRWMEIMCVGHVAPRIIVPEIVNSIRKRSTTGPLAGIYIPIGIRFVEFLH